MKTHEVVAAVIQWQGLYLALQRGHSPFSYLADKYEFPGGKIEAGESQAQALIREIQEEMDWLVQPQELLLTVHHQYPDFRLILHAWLCVPQNPQSAFKLLEHVAYRWCSPQDLDLLDWAAADWPVVEWLMVNG